MNKTFKSNRLNYFLFYIIASIVSFGFVFFVDTDIRNYTVVVYLLVVFGFFMIRYMIILMLVSDGLKADFPKLYKHNMGISRMGSTRLISPTLAFNAKEFSHVSEEIKQMLFDLKRLLVLLLMTFLSGVFLAIITILW